MCHEFCSEIPFTGFLRSWKDYKNKVEKKISFALKG
jgi:hypothetical protein